MIVDFSFVLLHISAILSIVLLVTVCKMKGKTQLHYCFIAFISLVCIWEIGLILEIYTLTDTTKLPTVFSYFHYFGLMFVPAFIVLTGIIYLKNTIKVTFRLFLLFILPIIDYLMYVTNEYHHLYFVKQSLYNDVVIHGKLFIIHTIISYIYIFAGLGILLYASIKNSGIFSTQSILILVGIAIPLTVNIIATFGVIRLPLHSTPITFSFGVVVFAIAIFRYNFLKISPIALRTVIDKISDSFIVTNNDKYIIDYNQTMATIFNTLLSIRRNISIEQVFERTCLMQGEDNLIKLVDMAKTSSSPVKFEKHIKQGEFDKHFSIEVTPIISGKIHLGTIILFRDITENVKHLADIEEKHAILMEQERLASLGQLIGGIAHNLKTPIMSISGAVEGLKDLVYEYEQSVGDETVTDEDHREIAEEMRTWLNKIQPYCAYMIDIIDTVKGQAMSLSNTTAISFSVHELVKRIELLLRYELLRYSCTLNTEIKVNSSTELYGDINSLIQVFDNIIINAIQAYEGKNGKIEFIIEEINDSILFTVRDYAKGIPRRVKDKLLKEMVTTKGTAGTGLGLYMSYSTIKARFEGKMWFESTEGKGTTFYIQLPLKK